MSAKRNIKSGSVVTWEITIDGTPLPDNVQIVCIAVEKPINRIASATITILDGSATKELFDISSANFFVPGAAISIGAGYNSDNTILFEGMVTQQAICVEEERTTLEVQCKDEAVKMIVGRSSEVYSQVTDSEAMTQLIKKHALSADVTTTSEKFPELVQYYASDWDFLLSRAEVNSMVVTTLNGKVSVFKPGQNTSPVLEVIHGENLYSFQAALDAVPQLASVQANAWDYKTQTMIKGEATSKASGPGNWSSKSLADKIGGAAPFSLQTTAPLAQENLTTWAEAQIEKREYAKICGEVRFQGNTKAEPGNYLTLVGLGTRFNGDHFISKIVHTLSDGNWFTEATVGVSPLWFVQETDVMAPPASGLLPGVQGLFNAIVKKIHEDPESEFRILLEIPLFEKNDEGIWARLANFYATENAGAFFLPEVGDEVIVGFLNEDPRFPVILGSLYNSEKHKPFPDLVPDEKNSKKAIVTKGELRIMFDDENKIVTVTTPGNNLMVLDDKEKQIRLQDEHDNTVVLSSEGISLKSSKDINLEAGQKVSIQGKAGISITASGGDVETSGVNIKEAAKAEFSAKGNATAQVQGGAQLTLKAALVRIN